MTKLSLQTCASLAALAIMGLNATAVQAQQAAPPADQGEDTLKEIVVTASPGNRTRLDTSASVSSVSQDVIQSFNATSPAELYRLLPGIQVPGTGGPGGNANISVRGLRTPTGGSPFVQVQEDGLPTVLFGDIQFGNNDYWTHMDPMTARVEAIRGGTAATFASQAVGAVINHISKTDRAEGGFFEIQKGLNYDITQVDARYSGGIGDHTWFNVGGTFDIGHGQLHAGYNVSNSYAIKGNITHELGDNRGWVRLYFKAADTQEPDYNASLSQATVTGTSVTNVRPMPNYDGRSQSGGYSLNNRSFYIVDFAGNRRQVETSGISTKQKWLQGQVHYDFGGVVLDDNARVARMSGSFNSPFFGATTTSSVLGSTVNGATVARIVYDNGPNRGTTYSNPYINTNTDVSTNISHMDHVANDLTLSKSFELGGTKKAEFRLGWFYYSQRIAEDWHTNQTFTEAAGNNPAQLALLDSAGNLLTAGGIAGYNNNWGSCCARQFDYTFTDNAPYAALNLDLGDFNIDGSVRQEIFHGSGGGNVSSGAVHYINVSQVNPVTGANVTTQLPYLLPDGPAEVMNFTKSSTNWSVGLLWKANPDLSLFTRVSKGYRNNADRMGFNGYFNADGSLNIVGKTAAVDPVTQYELGLKNAGMLGGGRYTVELTGFYSKFSISTYELSQSACAAVGINSAAGCVISAKYKDYGLELFSTYRNGGLNLVLSATYDHSRQQPAGANVYTRSPGVPSLTYSGQVSYDVQSKATVGMNVTGQTSVTDGTYTYPGAAIFGAFMKVRPMKNLELGVDVYNLFNTFAFMGTGNGFASTPAVGVLNVSNAPGRTARASVRLTF